MKYMPRTEAVEAVQVNFGKKGWPKWLEGKVALLHGEKGDNWTEIGDGDYLVSDGETVQTMTSEDFDAKYRQARQSRTKEAK